MKSVVVATGLVAAAQAYQPLNSFWRRSNDTELYPVPGDDQEEGMTTLTVDVTEVETITSCAPTIVDCPAASATLDPEDLVVEIVTNTVRLTETVCPITEAEQISSSVVEEHETGDLPGVTLAPEPSAPIYDTTGIEGTGVEDLPAETSGALPVPGEEDDEVDEYPDEVPSYDDELPPVDGDDDDQISAGVPIPGEGDETGDVKPEQPEESGEVQLPGQDDDDVPEYEEIVTTEVEEVPVTETKTITNGDQVTEEVITSTMEVTVTKTITACPGGCEEDGAQVTDSVTSPGDGGDDDTSDSDVPSYDDEDKEVVEEEEVTEEEQVTVSDGETTTITMTTTGTRTVTVEEPEPTGNDDDSTDGGIPGQGDETEDVKPEQPGQEDGDDSNDSTEGGNNGGDQCECPEAATVTMPASTVYVTIGGDAPTPAPGNGDDDKENEDVEAVDDDEDDEDEDEDDDDEDCPADEIVTMSKTVTVDPAEPTGGPDNSTAPIYEPVYRRRNVRPQRLV